jgi:hypothetical protein
MSDPWINWTALAKIIGVGLLAGAGLPALFAVGLRALTVGSPRQRPDGGEATISAGPVGIAAAGACFAVVLAGIGYGIYLIVKG